MIELSSIKAFVLGVLVTIQIAKVIDLMPWKRKSKAWEIKEI